MPFGLVNATATFERLIEQTCLVYLDDITVFLKTFDQHLACLEEVINHIGATGLKL